MKSMIPFPLPPVLARLFELLEGHTEQVEEGFFMAEQDRNRQHQAQPVLMYVRPASLRGPETAERRPMDWIGEVLDGEPDPERLPRYARNGVPEYWRVEPAGPRIVVHTEPLKNEERYAKVEVFAADEPIRSLTFPGLELTPAGLVEPA
jgi:Uma2 family endonuclease